MLERIGIETDAKLVQRWCLACATVRNKRRSLGLPVVAVTNQRTSVRWTTAMNARLGCSVHNNLSFNGERAQRRDELHQRLPDIEKRPSDCSRRRDVRPTPPSTFNHNWKLLNN